MLSVLLVLAAMGLVGYAVYVQYQKTDPTMPVQARVWAAVTAAGAMIGASVMQWIGQ